MRPGGGGGEGDLRCLSLGSQCLSLVGSSARSPQSSCLLVRWGELDGAGALAGGVVVSALGLCPAAPPPEPLMNLDSLTGGERGDRSSPGGPELLP